MADRVPIHGDTVKLHDDAFQGHSIIVGHVAFDVAETESIAQLGCHRINDPRGIGDISLNDVVVTLDGVANVGGFVGRAANIVVQEFPRGVQYREIQVPTIDRVGEAGTPEPDSGGPCPLRRPARRT